MKNKKLNALYDFGGRLSKEFPSQIIMDITEVCNLACIHCPHPAFSQSKHYQARYLSPELNDKMIDEVRNYGQGKTKYIRYTSNGEPLVHPDGYNMIESSVKNSGVYVTITTNGTIMNEKRTQRLLDAGVHLIDISIDAFHAETYAKIRAKGHLETTRNNVLRLIQWINESRSKTKVVVSFIEQQDNFQEVSDFKNFWLDSGANDVVIRRLHTHSGSVKNMNKNHITQTRKPCLYPWERVTINAKGDLSFCPSDWVEGSYVANYAQTSIQAEWQGNFYQQLRKAHSDNNFSQHPFCGHCTDWSETRWPHEGRSYADMIEEFINTKK